MVKALSHALVVFHWQFITLVALVFSTSAGQLQAAAGEVTAGEFRLHTAAGTVYQGLLQDTAFSIQVSGMVARVVVRQTFANASDEWVEGEYVFPLSKNSAVDYMAMTVGERVIIGQVREKAQARRDYEKARSEGKKASLVTQQRPNLFTNRVANIAPGEAVRVELRYVETLNYDQGRFSLRLPTTITPRYIPGQAFRLQSTASDGEIALSGNGWSLATDQVPDAHLITPPMVAGNQASPLTVSAAIDAGLPLATVESLYHPATTSEDNGSYSLSLDAGANLTRDVVLRWTPQTGRAPLAAVFREHVNGNDYGLLMLMPPQQLTEGGALPRETIYVIDTSGSMKGVSIAQAREALLSGLGHLDAGDRFNIVEFNSGFQSLWPTAATVNSSNVAHAEQFIRRLTANGGTEMAPALRFALASSAPAGYVRQVVFITDGAVGNESALFNLIETHRGDSRLFAVGIGSAPNSHFMEEAATAGRGSYTYIGSQADIGESIGDLFHKIRHPLVTDIRWDLDSPDVQVFPNQAPDLYAGEPLVLVARWSGIAPQSVIISGMANGSRFAQSLPLAQGRQANAISKLWARRQLTTLYRAQSNTPDGRDALKQAIIDLALEHQLLSRHTSFIAIEDEVARPPQWMLTTNIIPSAMPAGNTMAVPPPALSAPAPKSPDNRLLAGANGTTTAVPLPQGALGLKARWLVVLFCCLGLVLLYVTPVSRRS